LERDPVFLSAYHFDGEPLGEVRSVHIDDEVTT